MDFVNGCFEASATIFVGMSILRVWKDRAVKGVSPVGVSFFLAWGIWNLFYYPHLGQWWSTAAAGLVAAANAVWVCLLFYYGRKR